MHPELAIGMVRPLNVPGTGSEVGKLFHQRVSGDDSVPASSKMPHSLLGQAGY